MRFSIIGIFLLASCSLNLSDPQINCVSDNADMHLVCDTDRGFTLEFPKWIWDADWQSDTTSVVIHPFPLTDKEKSEYEKYGIKIPNQNVHSCSPSLTGASQMTPLSQANGEASWGRVDAWDQMDEYGNFPEGYEPPSYRIESLCNKNGTPHPKEVYALCSQKDQKTVVICIRQMKDDPKMAEEIFKTFRWTE